VQSLSPTTPRKLAWRSFIAEACWALWFVFDESRRHRLFCASVREGLFAHKSLS
jgi:hypothetical protein